MAKKKTKPRKPKRINSRKKGAAGERLARDYLGIVTGATWRRGIQFQGGPDSPDVVCCDGFEGLHIEVKFGVGGLDFGTKLFAAALAQAVADAGEGRAAVLLWKRFRSPWLLTVARCPWRTSFEGATWWVPDDVARVLRVLAEATAPPPEPDR